MKKNNVRTEEPLHERTKGYKEYPPPPELAPFLECYWSYYTESSVVQPDRKPVIPDGCIDIIFDLDDRAPQRNFVVGAMTRPFYSDNTNHMIHEFKTITGLTPTEYLA